MKLHNFKPNTSLSEISQSIPMKFAYGLERNGEVEQLTHFVKCRDFLQDFLAGWNKNKSISIYGFSYTASKFKEFNIKQNELRVLSMVTKSNIKYMNFNHVLIMQLLASYLPSNHKITCTILEVDDSHVVLMWTLPKTWYDNPFHVSFFTALLRIAHLADDDDSLETLASKVSKKGIVDSSYWKFTQVDKDIIKWFLKNLNHMNAVSLWDDFKDSIGLIHNNYGWVGIRDYFKHYQSSGKSETTSVYKLFKVYKEA